MKEKILQTVNDMGCIAFVVLGYMALVAAISLVLNSLFPMPY